MRLLQEEIVQEGGQVACFDPSEFRPEGKEVKDFRDFEHTPRFAIVRENYRKMYENQTLEYAKTQKALWCKFDHAEMNVMDALTELNKLVDDSDPDVDVPNIMHAFQTAERIREKHPDKDWFHLTGLIHDLGKVMALWGQPQWSTVGDTFPLGCKFSDTIVFPDLLDLNPDTQVKEYSTDAGIYEPGCGLRNITMAWGHDEYLYQVLLHNKCTLPIEALYMIRFHSFYPWHTKEAYGHLLDDTDRDMLKWVREFK
ncbi:myo-inositol oxidase [Salpingoeca rosetta]|uniref:Inositol oxygenase n=1 Tax=Salpingoeca rosetta (strain ATCC 50818 / BSB-021) TaxID=946362 RepID=F2TWC5_SALR5|nr:myo-inositol oxidase [Salpingoeca rosetta]EGD72371.1 myo-inositol oxidase [Salpingoeca rosetta]|eukprot:XP_004998940.1 myo-inositol oxidase [Salpingoeca rosetta]